MLLRIQEQFRRRRIPETQVYRLGRSVPRFGADVYIQDNARVAGDVELHARVSVWFGAVIRADNAPIRIGEDSNVQDLAIIHALPGNAVSIGSSVSIGHRAAVHGATIGSNCLIGIGAVILDQAAIGPNTIVGASALVPGGRSYPGGVLLMGVPAVVVRELSAAEIANIRRNALRYVEMAQRHQQDLEPCTPGTLPAAK
jgi:carbonic anhydrase/acetyltransferase-like protein (isoleucine patch superfamily)